MVDPDTVSPGEYGEEVVYTPSQEKAWAGIVTVDDKAYSDEWGSYYTAWSPIWDSSEHVVGLVGVDFDASQISEQLNFSMIMILVSTALLIGVSIAVMVFYSLRARKTTDKLRQEVRDLSDNIETMFNEIEGIDGNETKGEEPNDPASQDFMKYIHKKTIDMTQRLRKHMAYMEQQANVDYLTKSYNTRAYSAQRLSKEAEIESGKADFAVAVFDINGLKNCNDNMGHECGDSLISATAEALKKSFSLNPVYRIGGDEFVVIVQDASQPLGD